MKSIKMSYKGFEFPVNSQSLEIELSKKTAAAPIIKRGARVQEICFNPTVISGAGILSGDGAPEQANRLMRIFREESSAYLFSPAFPPMRMFFKALKLSSRADKNCIEFSFEFEEEYCAKRSRHSFGYTYALQGENLYDIANRCEIPIEELFALNGFKDLFSVNEGDRIWLR